MMQRSYETKVDRAPAEREASPLRVASSLEIAPTVRLHEQLAELSRRRPSDTSDALASANRSMRRQDKSFGGAKDLAVSLSPLTLDDRDVAALRQTGERMFRVVERVLDWVMADRRRLERYFSDHRRVFPFLTKTAGADSWQVFSRYDVVVTPQGDLKLMELNAGCPAGFMHSRSFTQATATALAELGVSLGSSEPTSATIRPNALVDGLLALEAKSGLEPGLVGLLTDENGLTLELELLAEQFQSRGRSAEILDARRLRYEAGRLYSNDRRLSLSLDKFRVSVPESRNHCWKAGFESRYAAFLAAQQSGALAAANNLAALTIAEDKSLLSLFGEEEVVDLLDDDQRELVDAHVLWTRRLQEGQTTFEGDTVDLMPFVLANRERLAVKPANEGRGFGVVLGRDVSEADWEAACGPDPTYPRVVQQYVEPLSLPVVVGANGSASVVPMYLTLGLAIVNGQYEGVLSRVSPSRVTNVAREGMVQAVLQVAGD